MFIHSTKMETQVFLPQESSASSAAKPEPMSLQSRSMRLILLFISGLLLLIVGMVGLCIFMGLCPTVEKMMQTANANHNDYHANLTQRFTGIFKVHESNAQHNSTSFIFKVQNNGTYIIYGKEEKAMNGETHKDCRDSFYLFWKKPGTNSNQITEATEVMTVATDVELEENSEVFVERNCFFTHPKKYTFGVMQIA